MIRFLRLISPDYTDGKWHRWPGGDCPVPADAMVEALVMVEGDVPMQMTRHARFFDWQHENDPLVRFRVVPQPDGWAFRSRQGDVRDTAAPMIPPDTEE